jgi:uridine phosphorylase
VLLQEPKMSNHARGLWGYSGLTPAGEELSIQSTGMGGPSAALVLADLAELGVRRAVRVGTCTALDPDLGAGELLAIAEARAWGGGGAGSAILPDAELTARLRTELGGEVRSGTVASLDTLHGAGAPAPVDTGNAADMQTAALFARAGELEVVIAAVLIVAETTTGAEPDDEGSELAARRAGTAASLALSA